MIRLLFFFLFSINTSLAFAAPVRIGVSETILSLPLYVAEAQGFFRQRGVEVEFVSCLGGVRCIRNMLNGHTELSTATELPVVFNSFSRTDFAILTSFVSASNDIKVLALKESNVNSPTDLEGKKVGFVKGAASQYVLDLVLVYNGIEPDSVKLSTITPEDSLTVLKNQEVDAVCIWEPFASRILMELGDKAELVPIPKLYTETFNLIAMQSAIKNRPNDLQKIVQALKDATAFIQKNPSSAKELAARRLKVSAVLIDRIFEDYRYRLTLNRSLSRTMEGQARWALREGHVDQKLPQPNYSNFIYPDFLMKVDSSAVSIR